MKVGISKPQVQGSGSFKKPEPVELGRGVAPGRLVYWMNSIGDRHTGLLEEWDSNVAIVSLNGTTVAVEC